MSKCRVGKDSQNDKGRKTSYGLSSRRSHSFYKAVRASTVSPQETYRFSFLPLQISSHFPFVPLLVFCVASRCDPRRSERCCWDSSRSWHRLSNGHPKRYRVEKIYLCLLLLLTSFRLWRLHRVTDCEGSKADRVYKDSDRCQRR